MQLQGQLIEHPAAIKSSRVGEVLKDLEVAAATEDGTTADAIAPVAGCVFCIQVQFLHRRYLDFKRFAAECSSVK